MSYLEHVQRGRVFRPPRILIYGSEGIGKTTLAASADQVIVAPLEDGLVGVSCDRFPEMESYASLLSALEALQDQEHGYQALALDSLSALERFIWDEVCQESGVSSIEKAAGGFGKGYVLALTYWRELLTRLDQLRDQREMVILLIAHAKVERYEDPQSIAYDRYAPRLHKHASALVCEWCDAVLFATRKLRAQTEDLGFGRTRTIAHGLGGGGGDRVLRTVGSPACLAKNRFSLPEELPLSWDALMTALSDSTKE